jgi:hypothetical protein
MGMIDIENEVFNSVATELRIKYPDIYVVGEYVRTPPRFPCVSLVEMDNQSYQRTEDSGSSENHVSVMYEVNVYSNKTVGKKAECKAIAALIDERMLALGFARTMLQPIPNLDDATIYRMVGRYSAIISKDKLLFRR